MRRIDSAAVRCPRAAPHARACTRHLRAARTRSAVQRVLPLLRGASSPRCVIHRSPPRRSPPRRSRRLLTAAPPASALITAPLARRQLAHRQPTRRTPPHRSRTASLAAPLAHLCLSRRAAPSGPTLHRAACAPLAGPSRRSPPRRSRIASLTAPLAAISSAPRSASSASPHDPPLAPPSALPSALRNRPHLSLRATCFALRSALGSVVGRVRPRSAPSSAPSTAPASAPRHRLRPPAPRHWLLASLRAICFALRSALGSVVGSAAGSAVGSAFRSVLSSTVGSAPSAPPFRPRFRRRPRPLLRPRRAPQLGSAAHAGVGYPALCYLFDRRRCPALLCARSRLRCSRLLPRGCAQPRDCALPSRSGCGELPTAEPPPGTRHHAHDQVNTPRRAAAVVEERLLRAGESGCRQELLLRAVNTTHADTRHADTFTRHAARGTRLRGTRVHPFGRLVAMLLAFVTMTSAASSPPSSPPPPKLCNNTCLSCFGNGDSLPRQHGPRERTRLRGTRYAAHVYAAHVSTLLAGSLQCCWRSSP